MTSAAPKSMPAVATRPGRKSRSWPRVTSAGSADPSAPGRGALRRAALAKIDLYRLGRAAVADPTVGTLVRDPQVSQVTQPAPGRVDLVVGQGPGQLRYLEGESGW